MFGKTKTETQPIAPSAGINLSKDRPRANMTKTASITASMSWASATDYDLYALVVDRNGQVHHVANFGAASIPANPTYRGVRLGKDAGRSAGSSGLAVETVTIALDDTIAAVIPVAYSAQSNGTGSFRRYKVSLLVDNGAGETVGVAADNANSDDTVYTCVPAVIYHNTDGTVQVEYRELYSGPGSEDRPAAVLQPDGTVDVRIDAGPRNDYK